MSKWTITNPARQIEHVFIRQQVDAEPGAAKRIYRLLDAPEMAVQNSRQRQEFFDPVPADGIAVYQPQAAIDHRLQIKAQVAANHVRFDRVRAGAAIGVERVFAVGGVFDSLQVGSRFAKKEQVAVEQAHPVGLQVGDEVEDFWGKQIGVAKLQAARRIAQDFGQFRVGFGARDQPGRREMLPQSAARGLVQRSVVVNAERVAPTADGVKGFQRPDQVQPIPGRCEHVNFAAGIRRAFDRRGLQNTRANDVSVVRCSQAVTELLAKF